MNEKQFIISLQNLSPAQKQEYEEEAYRDLHRACLDLAEIFKNPRGLDHVNPETRLRVMCRLHAPVMDASLRLLRRVQPQLFFTGADNGADNNQG